MQEYTNIYIDQNEWVTDLFQKQYERWDADNDSVFLYYDENLFEEHFPPLAFIPLVIHLTSTSSLRRNSIGWYFSLFGD